MPANDGKMSLGGVSGRHVTMGDAYMGLDGFPAILSHRAFANVPAPARSPGHCGKCGPDVENVHRLTQIRDEVAHEVNRSR